MATTSSRRPAAFSLDSAFRLTSRKENRRTKAGSGVRDHPVKTDKDNKGAAPLLLYFSIFYNMLSNRRKKIRTNELEQESWLEGAVS